MKKLVVVLLMTVFVVVHGARRPLSIGEGGSPDELSSLRDPSVEPYGFSVGREPASLIPKGRHWSTPQGSVVDIRESNGQGGSFVIDMAGFDQQPPGVMIELTDLSHFPASKDLLPVAEVAAIRKAIRACNQLGQPRQGFVFDSFFEHYKNNPDVNPDAHKAAPHGLDFGDEEKQLVSLTPDVATSLAALVGLQREQVAFLRAEGKRRDGEIEDRKRAQQALEDAQVQLLCENEKEKRYSRGCGLFGGLCAVGTLAVGLLQAYVSS